MTFHQTSRYVIPALAELLSGRRIGGRGAHTCRSRSPTRCAQGVSTSSPLGPRRGSSCGQGARRARRAASRRGDLRSVYDELARQPFVGRTEAELAWWLEQAWHEAGADGPAFDAIVAFGENGARPHAKLRDEPIPEGTLVVVDAGCAVDGYRSDCTRTFFTGEPEGRLRELYDLCLQAQLDGLAAVAPGARGPRRRRGLARRDRGGRHGRALRSRARPRRRTRCPRGAEPAPRVRRRSRTRQRRDGRAGDLPRRRRRRPDRGHGGWSPSDGCERLTTVTKEPVLVG